MYKFLLNQLLYVTDLKDGKPYECVVIENDEVGKVKEDPLQRMGCYP